MRPARGGWEGLAKLLLNVRAIDVNPQDSQGMTVLMDAVIRGDREAEVASSVGA